MNNQTITKQLKQWLGEGKVKQTLEKLAEIAEYLDDSEFSDGIVMQTSRYNRNQEELNSGIISREEARTEAARLGKALLYYIHQLAGFPEIDIPPGPSQRPAPMPPDEPPKRQANNPLKVFISYAHKDENMKKDLREHMQGMVSEKLIEIWQDGEINPGQEWDKAIKKALHQADIVLFLVSVKFMNSDYIGKVELQETLERYKQGRVNVIPIILRPCDWQSLPISNHQALPDGGSPITQWKNPDEAYLNVVKGLRRAVQSLAKAKG